jgi:hypothetical protein
MQLPTVKLQNKRTGKIKIVNQTMYADNIAAWSDWKIVSFRGGSAPDHMVAIEREQERIEQARKFNPNSPAYADPQRAFEARSGAEITTAYTDEKEFTTAVVAPSDAPVEPEIEEREVPTIGGSQTVKVKSKPGRKPKTIQDEVL